MFSAKFRKMRPLVGRVANCVAGSAMAATVSLSAGPAAAEWGRLAPSRGLGEGAMTCEASGSAPTCLSLSCQEGRVFWSLSDADIDWPAEGTVTLTLSVGDRTPFTLTLQSDASAARGDTDFVPGDDAPLIEALKRGSQARMVLSDGADAQMPLSLRGSSRSLSHAEQVCADAIAAAAQAPGNGDANQPVVVGADEMPAFDQPSERFVPMFQPSGTAEDIDRARSLLADDLAQIGEGAALSVSRFDVDDRSALLVIETGPSTMLYGISGFGQTLAVVESGASWVIDSKVGTMIWADAENRTDGWPDLWMQNMRGMDQPFGLWRWSGSGYAFEGVVEE